LRLGRQSQSLTLCRSRATRRPHWRCPVSPISAKTLGCLSISLPLG
jgi:hypothetical protein